MIDTAGKYAIGGFVLQMGAVAFGLTAMLYATLHGTVVAEHVLYWGVTQAAAIFCELLAIAMFVSDLKREAADAS